MKVKEIIKLLQKQDPKEEVVIRFCLSEKDETGYVLETFHVGNYFDKTAIYGEYIATKEDCDYIGQIDLKELWEREYKKEGQV